ncbi:MAG: hypothetical protein LLF28_06590 [Nitrospiraceae bacterium]|nr:hypothetical protein [Nitrospiraceae bacterium]
MKKKIKSDFQKKFFLGLFLFLFAIIIPSISDAGYKIFLKNGSVIIASYYEKADGEVKIYFDGGIFGVPEKDILKITETADEPKKEIKDIEQPEKPLPPVETTKEEPVQEPPKDTKENQNRDELERKKAELAGVEAELKKTMIRVQALNNKSVSGTLTPADKSMFQQNMVRKRKLESDKKRLEDEIKALQQ